MELNNTEWTYGLSCGPDNNERACYSIYKKGGDIDEDSVAGIWGIERVGAEANAKLIAAAPEMIEALQKFTRGFEHDLEENPFKHDKADCEFYDEVKELINKAIGNE